MGAYAYVLVFFMRLLRPEQIARMDPEIMQKEHLELHHRCDEFVKGLKFIVPTVLLAFVCYALQIILQIAW